ncbi:hypothetical protein E2562_018145 [Oryza meyeriana var. granulata]|uniref:Uncharacterized protein n=1 Tax=Oryza meyeriana var. granulata TaxID=110450 RepID=A0A6G1C7K3_9ORYZ|nr:hypothetical protein E2562_018145 [Oryza meyeriana var. granulata]
MWNIILPLAPHCFCRRDEPHASLHPLVRLRLSSTSAMAYGIHRVECRSALVAPVEATSIGCYSSRSIPLFQWRRQMAIHLLRLSGCCIGIFLQPHIWGAKVVCLFYC